VVVLVRMRLLDAHALAEVLDRRLLEWFQPLNPGVNPTRVARWYLFKPKIPIWVKIGRALEWKMFAYFMANWIFRAILHF
jgi:hypothetical protein